ncbi:MAG: polysaccharide biosynthesis tyrosine autokinase [Acidimicrobiia bacterium]|nr:polysaccharide biosynthesis tyrosine autokinase [Acidimicrobiia bacterium]
MRPFQRHKGLIALTTVAVAASALFASLAQTKVYRATAVVRVPSSSQTNAEMTQLRSAKLRAAVAQQAGIEPKVTVERGARADEVRVVAKADSARGAADLANGFVAVHLSQVRDAQAAANAGQISNVQGHIADTQHQIDALTAEIAAARPQAQGALVTRRDALQHQLSDLQAQLSTLTNAPGPVVAVAARAPSAASSPNPLRNTLIGLVVGLVFGVLVALALDYFLARDPAVAEDRAAPRPQTKPAPPLVPAAAQPQRAPDPEPAPPPPPPPPPPPTVETPAAPAPTPEPAVDEEPEPEPEPEVEEIPVSERSGPGVPVLGMIPAVPPWRGRERPLLRRDQPTLPAAEAYRGLAGTLQHILPHRPLRSLVVTSPAPGDGRTTVVANLGIVLARAGRTVVVVDCDLRNPQLHNAYDLPNEAGFTSVLRGEAPLSRAVQDAPDEPRLQVLAAGPTPPAPGQLLSAQRTIEVLTALQAQADVVIIDTPVMAPGGDAAVVASISDAALVIAGAPSGQAGQLARAVDILDEIEGLVVGVVLNAVSDDDQDGRVAMLRRDMPRVSLA